MRQIPVILCLFAVLLVPISAFAQSSDRITILDDFGSYSTGEPLFIYGQIASISDNAFLIMQILNPEGDLCQIQQLVPLSSGVFITDLIPLKGRICGIPGEYEIKLFYGDYTKSTTFTVSPTTPYLEPTTNQKIALAQNLIQNHTSAIGDLFGITPPSADSDSTDLSELESSYVDLWKEFFTDDLVYEVNPLIRPAVSSSLNSVQNLLSDDEISFEISKSIDELIFAAVFYYEIGDKAKSIGLLTDAFVEIRNVNPDKVSAKRTLTFDELESALLNLMKKSDTVMSKPVKVEVAFIFARGTAPIYSEEITLLVDILSKSRYLDVVSRKQSDLYRLVQNDWESLKGSLMGKETIEELIALSPRVSDLHQASLLLRELDNVDRFISADSEQDSDLANLIRPDWDRLERDLALATSVSDILDSESKISQMVQVIDISTRISKSIEISQSNGITTGLVSEWGNLLERVGNADSLDEILTVIIEFDESLTELREKRNPLVVLEFEYKSMRDKAELQADYQNLFLINNALKILKTAKAMESGNPSITRIDRIEILLSWASDIAPKIKADLDSYNKDAYKVRASDILQRAKSLENLVELSLTKNRFLPNYIEFTETFTEKIDNARDLVIKNDLDQADRMVRDLFDEWTTVSKAYADDPHGSDVGYTVDELKRIEFRKRLDAFSNMVSTFYHADFSPYLGEYQQKMNDANDLIQRANFIDTESKISEIGNYLSEHLTLDARNIIYDISYDSEKTIWVISGATEKSVFDRRENLYVTVYNMDGSTHSSLEFTDTREGNFYTQWFAPTEPGLYVVMLQYKASKASQIVHVEEEFDYQYSPSDLSMVELAREFEELESFSERFGSTEFKNNPRFTAIINQIESAFKDRNAKVVGDNIQQLKTAIERYLPVRSRTEIIEAVYDNDLLLISGAVQKAVAFREDLFIDVYNQKGELIREIAIKDKYSGQFSEEISLPLDPGMYVIQLQYHDVTVTDFFNVSDTMNKSAKPKFVAQDKTIQPEPKLVILDKTIQPEPKRVILDKTIQPKLKLVILDKVIQPKPPSTTTATVSIPVGTSIPGCEDARECYLPFETTVTVGTTVSWINNDTSSHTVTAGSPANGPSAAFDSSLLFANDSYSFTFEDTGSYDYYCMLHPWMIGHVNVI